MEGIWTDDFRERAVTEARFREISGDPDLLYDRMEDMLPIQIVREEHRILRYGRMWSAAAVSSMVMASEDTAGMLKERAVVQSAVIVEPLVAQQVAVIVGACGGVVPAGRWWRFLPW